MERVVPRVVPEPILVDGGQPVGLGFRGVLEAIELLAPKALRSQMLEYARPTCSRSKAITRTAGRSVVARSAAAGWNK